MLDSDLKHPLDLETTAKSCVDTPSESLDAQYDPEYVRKTLRHVDWRLLPLLGLVYSVALIDRTNLGIASTAGMDQDIGIYTGNRYNIASAVYFPSYILLQIPGNIILRILGARTWLAICVIGWAGAQLGMAFVPNWGILCVCRVLLGAFEAGFFPALAYIITTWYKRHEVQKRLAVFLSHIDYYWRLQLHFCIWHRKISGQGQPQWMAMDLPSSRNNHDNSWNIDVVLRCGLPRE